MSVWLLNPGSPEDVTFPPPECANIGNGLLAVGGDYSVSRLVEAYSNGIFPWMTIRSYGIGWNCPDPRFVLLPEALHIPKSLKRTMRKNPFEITVDRAFDRVIAACAEAHPREGVWITDALRDGYVELHRAGHAHSVEAWHDGQLVGGFYGVAVGPVFCGESMFALVPDASKVAFATMAQALFAAGCPMIDCQVHTDHLARFGACEMPRDEFLARLRSAIRNGRPMDWGQLLPGQNPPSPSHSASIPKTPPPRRDNPQTDIVLYCNDKTEVMWTHGQLLINDKSKSRKWMCRAEDILRPDEWNEDAAAVVGRWMTDHGLEGRKVLLAAFSPSDGNAQPMVPFHQDAALADRVYELAWRTRVAAHGGEFPRKEEDATRLTPPRVFSSRPMVDVLRRERELRHGAKNGHGIADVERFLLRGTCSGGWGYDADHPVRVGGDGDRDVRNRPPSSPDEAADMADGFIATRILLELGQYLPPGMPRWGGWNWNRTRTYLVWRDGRTLKRVDVVVHGFLLEDMPRYLEFVTNRRESTRANPAKEAAFRQFMVEHRVYYNTEYWFDESDDAH